MFAASALRNIWFGQALPYACTLARLLAEVIAVPQSGSPGGDGES
jgi:hypothetical protein